MFPSNPELIVVASAAPQAGVQPAAFAADNQNLQNVLADFGARLLPIFPRPFPPQEDRLMFQPPDAGVQEQQFCSVQAAPESFDELLQRLLNETNVLAAYIKPPAKPPLWIEQEEEAASTAAAAGAAPAAPTGNFEANQSYLDPAPRGIDARHAWGRPGGRGEGIRVIDIEGAWRFTHEDLIQNQGGLIAGTQSPDLGWRNHGTAVVGVIGGDHNGFGVTGICPEAYVRAISIFGGVGSAGAIKRAADALGVGDIILIELHRPGPDASGYGQDGYIPVEWWPDDFAAIRYATSRGVLVVEAAGNGSRDLDAPVFAARPTGFPPTWTTPFSLANPQSGAILVGAGAPPPGTHGRNHGVDRSRLGFSNWGSRVDCQGWGREVTTTGYGDLQGGNEDVWYTDEFSGTSSASPIVVGALGCIQGALKAARSPSLNSATAIHLLRTTGTPQQGDPARPVTQRIGNRPDLRAAFASLGI